MIGQAVLNLVLAVPESHSGSKLLARGLNLFRRALSRVWDPLVSYELDGRRILLPLSHSLPVNRKKEVDYSSNLGRICAAIAAARSDATAIDIGANVGDSVAIIRGRCALPILCIEPDPRYLRILEGNLPVLGPDVFVYGGFVAAATGTVTGAFQAQDGTARLTPTEAGKPMVAKALADILRMFPRFSSPALVKIDTDGFDIPILRGALSLLSQSSPKPVLFFEYDPSFLSGNADEGLHTLEDLRKIGYEKALVYDNLGDLMLSADLADRALWRDMHAYFSGREGQRYMDLCLFSAEDQTLFDSLRKSERAYFASKRS